MSIRKSTVAIAAAIAAIGALIASFAASAAPRPAKSASAASILGSPHKAKGSPYVFAMVNLEGGPVAFNEAQQGAQAAASYVNNYMDGINGHPIKIVECSDNTLTPATSASCANQLVGDHPLLVLGGADIGAAGAFPIWQSHHLAYIGGSSFTPVESNAPNAVIFSSLNVADNAAALYYGDKTLGIKKVSIIEANDAQGLATGKLLESVAKGLGMSDTLVPLSDTASASDYAAAAATAEAGKPGLIYVEAPANCSEMVAAIGQSGYSGKIAGIDPCAAPPAIKAEGSASNGLFYASPFVALDSTLPAFAHQIALTKAILAKYAPSNIIADAPMFEDFGAIMNIEAVLPTIKGKLTEASILKAFRKPGQHTNWLAHPYDCSTHLVPAQSAVCEPYQQIFGVKNGAIVTVDSAWQNGAKYYNPKVD
jgi:branched-chain amino acid transport system substrate-binding protein